MPLFVPCHLFGFHAVIHLKDVQSENIFKLIFSQFAVFSIILLSGLVKVQCPGDIIQVQDLDLAFHNT